MCVLDLGGVGYLKPDLITLLFAFFTVIMFPVVGSTSKVLAIMMVSCVGVCVGVCVSCAVLCFLQCICNEPDMMRMNKLIWVQKNVRLEPSGRHIVHYNARLDILFL